MNEVITPAITVFDNNGNIDYTENKKIIEHLINGGVDGILILGSTGEFYSMTSNEKKELIKFYINQVNSRIPVYVGTGTNEVENIIELSNFSIESGAKGVMILPPYYYKIDDNSLYNFYNKIAKNIKGEIYIYNFPDRTTNDVNSEVVLKLLDEHENIVGYKDSVPSAEHTKNLINSITEKYPNFKIYSGFDSHFIDNSFSGGSGIIGALSNIKPDLLSGYVKEFNHNNLDGLQKTHKKIIKLMKLYEIRDNFIPIIKYALTLEDVITSNNCSFPTKKIDEKEMKKVKQIMEAL